MLIYDVKLDEVRAALAATSSATRARAPSSTAAPAPARPAPTASLIDFANFSPIPRTFTSAAEHPKNTNLLCWHCCAAFTHAPRFIALESSRASSAKSSASPTSPALTWSIDGNFCSWPCAAAYIHEHYVDPRRWSLMQNLAIVRAQCDGVRVRAISPAPDRIKICLYSGRDGMSQQAFAEIIEKLSDVPAN